MRQNVSINSLGNFVRLENLNHNTHLIISRRVSDLKEGNILVKIGLAKGPSLACISTTGNKVFHVF